MSEIKHILLYKLIIFRRKYSELKAGDLLKNLGVFCVYGGFAVGSYLFTINILDYLVNQVEIGYFLLHQFISMTLFISFLTISAGNVIVSYSTLYRSPEVKFLFSKPVNPTNIFIMKFFDNFFYSSSTLILIILSVFSAYCVFFKMNILTSFYLFLFNIIPFLFSGGAVGVILLMLLVRLSSKFGFKNIVLTLALLYIIFLVLFFKVVSPVNLIDNVMKYYPDIDRYLGFLIPSFNKYLPNNWLSETLYWILTGSFQESIMYTLFINAFFFVTSSTALWLGYRWYNFTWLSGIGSSKKQSETVTIPKFNFQEKSYLSPFRDAVLKREIYLFLREPSQLLHFLILIVLILIFIFSLKGIDLEDAYNFELKTILYLSMYLFNLLIITTLSLRFVFPLISLEGKEFWRIKSSPVTVTEFLNKKKKLYLYLILVIGFFLAYYPSTNINVSFAVVMSLISILASQNIFIINYSMGAAFVNFSEKNPIRLASSQGASLSFLFSIIYMVLIVSILFIPLREYFFLYAQNRMYDISLFYYPFLLIAIFSFLINLTVMLYLRTKYSKL